MPSEFPALFRLQQRFERPRLEDREATVVSELEGLELASRVRPGQTVALTAGSRGIVGIHEILRGAVRHLRELGAEPFIVPAMGSHGGGTAAGQRELIESYGVTEEYCDCPIRSSMETVLVCETPQGIPVHFDRLAYEADHVVVANRIKPHTKFVGDIESGLFKMMLIGLGKKEGAEVYHRAIQDHSFTEILQSVAAKVLERCRILCGIGIVENAYKETARIEAFRPEAMAAGEKELLVLARRHMPRLPFDRIDVLIVDRIGKDISGTGLDTNVVGRRFNDHRAQENESPKVRNILVRGLSEATHGNAMGIGIADFTTQALVEAADLEATRLNALTSLHYSAARLPFVYPTDREALAIALSTLLVEPSRARVLWIRDTLDLEQLECSEAYVEEARARDDLEILGPPGPLCFRESGELVRMSG